jgi:3-dehydroquinate synthase
MARAALELSFPKAAFTCSLLVEDGLLEGLSKREIGEASSIAIITDDIVANLYGVTLQETLSRIAPAQIIAIPHGERSKNLNTVTLVAAKMSKHGFNRKTALFALGGGVVGDLSGFVASVFKRGIKYFQLPTTLLAMVDSSIGGKTGVDTKWGKNQLGSFYQPLGIFVDPSTLDTLPEKELINGIAEMAKSAIIADAKLFAKVDAALSKEVLLENLKPLIIDTCKIKAQVVQEDEREQNVRAILNYGHTVGHALESASGYRLSHGKSVVLGMICEGWIARQLGIFQEDEHEKQRALLSKISARFGVRPL